MMVSNKTWAIFALAAVSSQLYAQTVVRELPNAGWNAELLGGASVNLNDSLGSAIGQGAAVMSSAGVGERAWLYTEQFSGTRLDTITEFRFSSITSANNIGFQPYVNLLVQFPDTFEGTPFINTRNYIFAPGDFNAGSLNTWNSWDLLTQPYWRRGNFTPMTWADVIAEVGDQVIGRGDFNFFDNVPGTFSFGMGDSSSAGWANRTGAVDNVIFATNTGISTQYDFEPIPEPMTLTALGLAGLGLAARRRRQRKA